MNKEAICKTCGDTGKRMCAWCSGDGKVGIPPDILCKKCEGKGNIPCPDCQQPPAGEFTEKLRNFVKLYENELPRRAEITFLQEACDRLGRAEAINKDLLTACKFASDLTDLWLDEEFRDTEAFNMALQCKIQKIKDAIAKAKKE